MQVVFGANEMSDALKVKHRNHEILSAKQAEFNFMNFSNQNCFFIGL